MKKKRLIGVLSLVLATALLFTACSQGAKSSSSSSTPAGYVAPVATKGTIQMLVGSDTPGAFPYFNAQSQSFTTKYPDVKVVISNVGTQNYNTLMKVKMAANQLPDVFGGTGWIEQDQPYCLDLKNEPWLSKVNDGIKPAITAKNGKICYMPLGQVNTGLEYNTAAMTKYGINPDTDLKTVDDWIAACAKIQKADPKVYSMYIGGGDGWPLALFYNFLGNSAFVTNNNPEAAKFLDGTEDFSGWAAFVTKVKQLTQYFNPDYLTAKNSDAVNAMAQEKAVFGWGEGVESQVRQLNPNINFSFVPIPAYKAGDVPAFVGDLRSSMGIWKDSTLKDDCRLFLQYWTDPGILATDLNIEGYQSAIVGVVVPGFDNARIDHFKDTPVYGIFDQKMLPNMWDSLVKGAGAFGSGSETAAQWASDMKTDYQRNYALAKASSK